MYSNNNKNILLCVTGRMPQIITEALYILTVRQGIRIDEIYVLTTNDCKSVVEENLSDQIIELSRFYGITKPKISNDNILGAYPETGYSGITEDSYYSTTDLIFDHVGKLCNEENRIFFCLSGGRKTMSSDLVLAYTIYAREQDVLFHVVTDENKYPNTLYFPKTKVEDSGLFYIEKVTFRLRNKLDFVKKNAKHSFREIMLATQQSLNESLQLDQLVIDTKQKCIIIGSVVIPLQPLNFAVYLLFAKSKSSIIGGKNFSRANSEKLWKIYRRISTSKGQTERVARNSIHNDVFDFDIIQKSMANIRSMIKRALNNSAVSEYYIITASGSYANKKYEIRLPKSHIKII